MTGHTTAAPAVTPSALQLDILELVRSGALPAYPLGAARGSITIPVPSLPEEHASAHEVELRDLEGAPLARLPLVRTPEGASASGTPTWLSDRARRPYEQWHRGPESVADHTGLVVLRAPSDPDRIETALAQAGSRPLLLVLAALDGDVGLDALETVRQARSILERRPGTGIAIAPVGPDLPAAEQEAVVRSYAHNRPVMTIDPGPPGTRPAGGTVLLLTGLSGSGKSTLARAVRNRLLERGERVTLLDGDLVRRHLSAGLGFSVEDRDTNVRRIGWVAAQIAHHGGTVICSPIAPRESTRQEVREMVESTGGRFLLVHVATPLEECERRDRKNLYARARRGEIPDFTGISSPYETPARPDLRVDTTGKPVDGLADEVLALLDLGRSC